MARRLLALAMLLLVITVRPASADDPRAVEIAERMMEAMGGRAAFDEHRLLHFEWIVERDGETVSAYRHWWDRPTGRYRVEGTNQEGVEFRVVFNINDRQGIVWADGSILKGEEADAYLGMAYGRFINDSYWLLMPWKWLDPGVTLHHEGERRMGGEDFDVVRLSFDADIGLTSGDQYWAFVSRKTGLMERWEYVLQKDDGSAGEDRPTVWSWKDWEEFGDGIRLSTRKELEGGEQTFTISFPSVTLSREASDQIFNPIIRPEGSSAPPAEPTGRTPAKAGVSELLVVLNKSDHTASLVDMQTYEVLRTVPTGFAPHEGIVSADGRTLYVSNYGGRRPGNSVSVIDLPSGTVRRVVELGEHTRPHGLAVGPDGSLWVTAEGSGSVLRLAPGTLEIQDVYKTGQDITHMIVLSRDGKLAFTTNIGSGTVSVIDVESGGVRTIKTGAGAEGVDITPDGEELWVAHRQDDEVAILDVASQEILGRVPSCAFPIRVKVTPDGERVLVSCARSNELQVIDRQTREELGRVALNAVPIGIQISPDGKLAFIANTQADQISVVDLETLQMFGAFAAGREPDGLAWAKW